MPLSNVRNFHRDDIECDLQFVGFLIISTPLKPESKPVVQELLAASHHVRFSTFPVINWIEILKFFQNFDQYT